MRPFRPVRMNSNNFDPGDILFARQNEWTKGYHPIVYISGRSDSNFIGAMITHDPHNGDNVKMNVSHFVPGLKVGFDDNYLVRARLIKPEEWGPFEKVGQLTEIGLKFVTEIISDLPEESFAHYFARSRIAH